MRTSTTKYLQNRGINTSGMSLKQKWALKRQTRPGVLHRTGFALGRFLGRRAGRVDANYKMVLPSKNTRMNGLQKGFAPAATKSFVRKNPLISVTVGAVALMSVAGFLNMTYRMTKGASRMIVKKPVVHTL